MTEQRPSDRARAWKGPSAPASNVHAFTPRRKLAVGQQPEGQPEDQPEPDLRRAALARLVFILLLVAGGLVVVHILGGMSRLQDCVMSGRTNCAPIAPAALGN